MTCGARLANKEALQVSIQSPNGPPEPTRASRASRVSRAHTGRAYRASKASRAHMGFQPASDQMLTLDKTVFAHCLTPYYRCIHRATPLLRPRSSSASLATWYSQAPPPSLNIIPFTRGRNTGEGYEEVLILFDLGMVNLVFLLRMLWWYVTPLSPDVLTVVRCSTALRSWKYMSV